jgi:hypothetical protein
MTPASPKIKSAARVSPYPVAHRVRDWARGSDSTHAPVELLIRSFSGRSSQPEQPCIVVDRSGQIGLNAEVLAEGSVGDAGRRAASGAVTVGVNSVDLAGGSHRFGSRSFSLGPCCAAGDESVGLYQLRATSEVTDRS